ncbi:hypothetical protein BTA51_27465 [Hahella sp. CCB-MM4]|uniref:Imm44 family immunity protein n=1 Tax=Hahella sp. (strain CCB-MM4) TaxID=1926491 RepID=UPI000B9A56E7|nr:Imm44 family immunity protein [Hahella sp. CCB-MM4]OZG70207.1 hypothetical protein BTA51_27465 [Hahella sp. CCB-MM4]
MKLWIGGELQADVADNFRAARKKVENAINDEITRGSYEVNLVDWDCIAILREDNEFKEITKYSSSKKEMDYRLNINFQEFKNASAEKQESMIFDMLKRSLTLLKEKKGINVGEIERLIRDVDHVGKVNGWR